MIEGLNEDWNSDIKLKQTAAQRRLQLAITQSVRYERSLLHSLYLTILSVREFLNTVHFSSESLSTASGSLATGLILDETAVDNSLNANEGGALSLKCAIVS